MSGRWTPVVRLRFMGGRYDDGALDAAALGEILRFQQIVALTARDLWRRRNPERGRLPRDFARRAGLRLRALESGSPVAALDSPAGALPPCEDDDRGVPGAAEAVDVVHGAFRAIAAGESPPEDCPRSLLPRYARLGARLSSRETLEIDPPGKPPVRVTSRERRILRSLAAAPRLPIAEDRLGEANIAGRITSDDLRQGRRRVWLDDAHSIPVAFASEHAAIAAGALEARDSMRVHVRGEGQFAPDGSLRKILRVDELDVLSEAAAAPDIMEEMDRIFAKVPEEAWEKVPNDLSERHDHYIYGVRDK